MFLWRTFAMFVIFLFWSAQHIIINCRDLPLQKDIRNYFPSLTLTLSGSPSSPCPLGQSCTLCWPCILETLVVLKERWKFWHLIGIAISLHFFLELDHMQLFLHCFSGTSYHFEQWLYQFAFQLKLKGSFYAHFH